MRAPAFVPAAALAASAALIAGCAVAQAQSHAGHPQATATASAPAPIARAALKTAQGGDAGAVTAYTGPKGTLFVVEGKG